jgi:non-specific serine/threonine protein kinase
MKRCPECRRDYADDTLLYCLEDGTALVQGSVPSPNESQTAILHNTSPPTNADTGARSNSTDADRSGWSSTAGSSTRIISSERISGTEAGRSIAVLPFRNINKDGEDEYFCDGLTEEIISDLSAVKSLKVISRASSMKLKGTHKDSRTIAAELNVRFILDGSVRKAGNKIRISAQLIDGLSDENLWADKYSGTLDDIFEIQENVSRSIVDALKITLKPDEQQKLEARDIENPIAYDLYLKARSEFVKGSPEALDRAIDLLQKGLEIIGDNELILASLGYAHYHYFRWISKLDKDHLARAHEYMQRTFEFNPGASHGHVLKGLLAYSAGEMPEMIRSLRNAVEIDPTNPQALFWLSINLNYVGSSESSRLLVDRLCELDPLQAINIAVKAVGKVYAGEFEQAIPWIEKSLKMDPNSPLLIWTAAITEAWAGNDEKAVAQFDRLFEVAPNWIYTKHGLFQKYAMLGQKERALQYNLPEMAEESKYDSHFALHMAECFAIIGEIDTAFEYLTLAVEHGLANVRFLGEHDRFLAGMRSDERFGEILRKAAALVSRIEQLEL